MRPLLVIGDIHGKVREYAIIAETAELQGYNTLQLGDFGFAASYAQLAAMNLDPNRHMFFMGNHDAYNCNNIPHNIGDFGLVPSYSDIFFVRGGFSIDKKYRTIGVNWFYEEELTHAEFDTAEELYLKLRPRVLVCHEPPYEIGHLIGNPDVLQAFGFNYSNFSTRTSLRLQSMIQKHPPEICVFGHFHVDVEMTIASTKFIGLGELKTCAIHEREKNL